MKIYLIWAASLPPEIDTTCRDTYIERFPEAAQYGDFLLFPSTDSEIPSLSCEVLNLSARALVEDVSYKVSPNDLTLAEFDALIDSLEASTPTGRCVVLSVSQGRYLHQTRYATPQE